MRNLLEKGYSYVRRFLLRRNTLFSSSDTPQQQSYTPEERYTPPQYSGAPSGSGYPQQRDMNPQQGYPQQGYTQREGMNPWVAGGLGALGGGLAGYGLGQAVGELQQYANGDYHPADGQNDYADSGPIGEDPGGGDFGGE